MISEQFIKDNSVIDENVDVKLLRSTIWDCQRDYIKPILGTDLYNKLESDIKSGSVSGNYLILLNDYVAESLIKWVVYESVPTLTYKYRNKSVGKGSSDHDNPINYAEIKGEMDRWRIKAELRSQDLTNYLCAKSVLFPEYSSNVDLDDIKPKNNNFTIPIYLG